MKTYLFPLIVAAGLLAGCNQSVEQASQDFNALPAEVQKAVRAQAPDAEIARVDSQSRDGMQVFEIEFRDSEANPTLLVASDGRILNSPGTSKTEGLIGTVEKALTPTGAVGTQFSALPMDVQKAIQAHAPPTEIRDIARNVDEGRVIYTIEFQDSVKNPTLKIAEDGTLVQGLQKRPEPGGDAFFRRLILLPEAGAPPKGAPDFFGRSRGTTASWDFHQLQPVGLRAQSGSGRPRSRSMDAVG